MYVAIERKREGERERRAVISSFRLDVSVIRMRVFEISFQLRNTRVINRDTRDYYGCAATLC